MRALQAESEEDYSSCSFGQVHRLTLDFAACSWKNVFVVIWRSRTRAADAQEIRRLLKLFSRDHSEGYFLFTIVQAGAPPPDVEARRAIAGYLKAGAAHIIAGAVVITGGPFRVAFVRGVATGLVLLARQPFPFRVCTLENSMKLFTKHGNLRGVQFHSNEFLVGLQQLRSRIDEEVPTAPSGVRSNTLF